MQGKLLDYDAGHLQQVTGYVGGLGVQGLKKNGQNQPVADYQVVASNGQRTVNIAEENSGKDGKPVRIKMQIMNNDFFEEELFVPPKVENAPMN